MTLILSLKNSFCGMITNQTRPPRMSFEFRPQNITQFNMSRAGFFARFIFVRRLSITYARFLSINWRKTPRSFFRGMVLLFVRCFTANWRRRLLRFWCFCEVGEERRHVYLLDQLTHVNFPAFLVMLMLNIESRLRPLSSLEFA